MDAINKILENPMSIVISIILCAVAIKYLMEVFGFIANKLGIETKWSIEKKKHETELDMLKSEVDSMKQSQNELKDAQNEMKISLQELHNITLNREIKTMRYQILDFANAVMNNRDYNKESYDHIFDVYEDYEEILELAGQTNGQVERSMNFINEKYSELMRDGFKK